jgi:hypothetical protein
MAVKKSQVIVIRPRAVEQELETLYARRSALDALIESLEDYDRSQARIIQTIEYQTA